MNKSLCLFAVIIGASAAMLIEALIIKHRTNKEAGEFFINKYEEYKRQTGES